MNAKVRDVMTPGPIGVDYHQSIGTAARTMRDWGVGAVLVVSDQALYGLVTDRDLVVRATTRLGDICTGELAVLRPDDDVQHAARLVRERAVRRLPVIAGGVPVGVVSIGDLALDRDERSALSKIPATAPDR